MAGSIRTVLPSTVSGLSGCSLCLLFPTPTEHREAGLVPVRFTGLPA
jgi:hypothetical protein